MGPPGPRGTRLIISKDIGRTMLYFPLWRYTCQVHSTMAGKPSLNLKSTRVTGSHVEKIVESHMSHTVNEDGGHIYDTLPRPSELSCESLGVEG